MNDVQSDSTAAEDTPGRIGIAGLGPMGANLAANFLDHGFTVDVCDINWSQTMELQHATSPEMPLNCHKTLADMTKAMPTPRVVLLSIPDEFVPDATKTLLAGNLSAGDVIVDGGNCPFDQTAKLVRRSRKKKVHFIGMGISGGAEGARHGPSLMPGGDKGGWPLVENFFKTIAARGHEGIPCCIWIGPDGAGHFVKMEHNGIEYAIMGLIAEAYDIMRRGLKMEVAEIAEVFQRWNEGPLQSFLIEITVKILRTETESGPFVDRVLDVAGHKGTGVRTIMAALSMGVSASIIGQALATRLMAARRAERELVCDKYKPGGPSEIVCHKEQFIGQLENALYAAVLLAYTQGFRQLREAAPDLGGTLPYREIALIWTGGCIIRSKVLLKIAEAFEADPDIPHLIIAPVIMEELKKREADLAQVIASASGAKIPCGALAMAQHYLLVMGDVNLPMNVTACERDLFGLHGLKYRDRDRSSTFHGPWAHEA